MKIKIEYVVNHSGIYEIPGGLRNEDEILDEELDIGIEIL